MAQLNPSIFLLLSGCLLQIALALPTDPAAVAADPAAAAVPVAAAPVESPAVAVAEPEVTKALPPVATPHQPSGGGVVTEHRNPDGSVITVTRYNGPLPADAFRNPLMNAGFFTGLHDNLYQTQLLQLQALRNLQYLNYNYYPIAAPTYPFYRSNPYVYTSTGNPFFSPFFGYGGGYPFGGYPGAYGKSA